MKQIKNFIIVALIIVLSTSPVYAENGKVIYFDGKSQVINHPDISIYVDNTAVAYQGMYPVMVDDRTLVPVRSVLEHPIIGATVTWVGEENKILVKKDDVEIALYIGKSEALVNGESITLDRAPVLISTSKNGSASTMVPIRFITEALGYSVAWDQQEYRIDLTSVKKSESEVDLPVIGPESEDNQTDQENNDDGKTDNSQTEKDNGTASEEVESTQVIQKEETYKFESYEDDLEFDETTMSTVKYNKYQDLYSIRTVGKMSSIKYFIWEGKLVVDIGNTTIGDIKKDVDVETNDFVRSVRSSQFSLEPLVVRVVFDLIDDAEPTGVTINEDRTRIDVLFGNNGLDEIVSAKTTNTDYLDIDGQYSDMNIFRLTEPYRIVVDLENTINPFGKYSNDDYDGNYVKAMRIAQFNETTTRIVFETENYVEYNVSKTEDGNTRITIGDASVVASDDPNKDPMNNPTQKEDTSDVPSIGGASVLDHLSELDTMATIAGNGIDVSSYEIEYDYINKTATISFNKSLSGATVNIKDSSAIKSKEIKSGKLVIKTDHIYDMAIVEQEGTIFLKGARPSDLYDKIVLIDPGHGGSDPGAVSGNYHEKDINLRVTEYFRTSVEKSSGIRYYFSRTKDIYPSLEERVEMASDLKADFFVSMHSNALDIKIAPYLSEINGLEVQITDKFEQSSEEKAVADKVFAYFSTMNIPIKAKSIKVRNDLYVLRNTTMPSVLIEMGYMSNENDLAFLIDEEQSVKMAYVLDYCIDEFFKNK